MRLVNSPFDACQQCLRSSVVLLVVLASFSNLFAQRDLKEIPIPDPVAEKSAMKLDDGIEVNLFAADPMFSKPIHSNFDSLGRLWVASSSVYPQIAPGEKADDKVIVLEDTDHDGLADKSTVFADNLLIPTGVLPDLDGQSAYVAASTQLLYLRDLDGDGKADERRVVLSGFGTEDTHHLLHTLRWGPDGWLYMNQSIYIHSHVETPYGTKHLDGGGIWRYHPETQRLEVVCKGFVNPWGHIFDATGQEFATDGAYGEGINFVFPGAVFVTSPGAERWLNGLNPGSPKHCGLEILTGSHIPPELYGQCITNDFRSHRVCRFQVTRNRDGYLSQQQPELIRTEHVAFRPIDAKVGPDGALYISDWYNPIIQHGEVDFRDDRRDRTHGRIWRISWKGRKLDKFAYRKDATIDELLNMLEDPLELTRQWARLDLARRPGDEAIKPLKKWASALGNDERPYLNTGLSYRDLRHLEALRISESKFHWDAALADALAIEKNPRVRATVIQMGSWNLERWPNALPILRKSIADPDWQVRLASVVALRKVNTPESLDIAMRVLDSPMVPSIDFSLWSFLRESEDQWSSQLDSNAWSWTKSGPSLLFAAKASKGTHLRNWLIARFSDLQLDDATRFGLLDALALSADDRQARELLKLVVKLLQANKIDQSSASALLDRIVENTSKRNIKPIEVASALGDWWKELSVDSKLTDAQLVNLEKLRSSIALAAGKWSVTEMTSPVLAWIEQSFARGTEDHVPPVVEGIGAMKNIAVVDALSRWAIDGKLSSRIREASIVGLAKQDLAKASLYCIGGIADQKSPPYSAMGLHHIAGRKGGPESLIEQIKEVKELPTEPVRLAIDSLQVNSIQRNDLIDALRAAGKLSENRWVMSTSLVQQLTELAKTEGDPGRGELLYRQASLQCSRCHPIGTAGGQIGPNLMSLGGSSQIDYIIESILDPQARLKEGFQTIVVLTEDGQVVSGLERSRTAERVSLLTAEGKVVDLERDSIAEEKSGKSLMPPGLVDSLSMKQLADLVRFLSEVGRTPAYTVSSEPKIRKWDFLQYTNPANTLLNRTSIDSVVTDSKVLEWTSMVAKVDGRLPLLELPKYRPHREMTPFVAIRSTLNCKKSGKIQMQVEGISKWLLWIDAKPVDLKALNGAYQLSEGMHTIHLVINEDVGNEVGVRVESAGAEAAVIDLGN